MIRELKLKHWCSCLPPPPSTASFQVSTHTAPMLASSAGFKNNPPFLKVIFLFSASRRKQRVLWGWERACQGRQEHLGAWATSRGGQKHFSPAWTMCGSESLESPRAQSCLLPPRQWKAVEERALFPFCTPIWLVDLLALLFPFLLITLLMCQECTSSKVMPFPDNCRGPR